MKMVFVYRKKYWWTLRYSEKKLEEKLNKAYRGRVIRLPGEPPLYETELDDQIAPFEHIERANDWFFQWKKRGYLDYSVE